MTQEENPLSSDLQALLDSERTYDASRYRASQEAVWSRVEATTGFGAGASAAASHVSAKTAVAAAKTASLLATRLTFAGIGLVAGGALGVAAHATLAPLPPAPQPIIQTVYVDRVLPSPPTVVASAAPSDTSAPSAAPSTAPAPSVAATSTSSARAGDLAKERELMDVARSAVASRHSDTALKALQEHATTFPRGALSEERDALWVQALANAGRVAEARSRAATFHKRYPNSMLSAAVDAAVAPPP